MLAGKGVGMARLPYLDRYHKTHWHDTEILQWLCLLEMRDRTENTDVGTHWDKANQTK